jgi:hypothetical protein
MLQGNYGAPPNSYAGKLHRTVLSRCAEQASIETRTGNNAAAVNAAEHIVADQAWFADCRQAFEKLICKELKKLEAGITIELAATPPQIDSNPIICSKSILDGLST